MMKTTICAAVFGCCLAQGCGTETGNPKKPGDAPKVFLVADPAVVNDLIASQTDEVFSATADDLRAIAGLSLKPQDPAISRSECALDAAGGAAVAITVLGQDTRREDAGGFLSTFVADRDEATRVVWRQAGAQLACNADATGMKIDWTAAEGLTLDASLRQKRVTQITRQGPRGTFTRQSNFELTGERHAVFAMDPAHAPADGLLVRKTVTSVVDKVIRTTRKRTHEPVTVASHIEVRAEAPVVVAIVREADGSAWRSKTIESGTVVTTQAEGSRLESTYSGLKFTADAGCAPVAGSVNGAIFAAGAAPLTTFKISFDAGQATITYQDGTTAPYVADYCGSDDTAKL